MPACPVGGLLLENEPVPKGRLSDQTFYDFRMCGRFGLTDTAVVTVPAGLQKRPEKRPVFSHLLREMQKTEEWPVVQVKRLKDLDA